MSDKTVEKKSENPLNKGDTGLELSGLQWLLDHHKAKEKYRRKMIEDLNLQAGDVVLDLGSGPGLWSDFFAENVAPNGRVVGLDLSAELIDYAKSQLSKSPYQEMLEYQQGDFLHLPYEDETFDLVFCGNSLSYLNDDSRQAILTEQKRVVKKGGRLVAKEFDDATTLVYPVPPELWLKVLACSAQVQKEKLSEERFDNFIGRQVRGILLKAGFEHIESIPYTIPIVPPLSPEATRYVTETTRWQIETATPYLSTAEIKELQAYFDPKASQYILDREEFYYSIGEIMSIVTV